MSKGRLQMVKNWELEKEKAKFNFSINGEAHSVTIGSRIKDFSTLSDTELLKLSQSAKKDLSELLGANESFIQPVEME